MNKKKVDKVKIYVILIEEPNISDFGRGPSLILKTDFEKPFCLRSSNHIRRFGTYLDFA